MAKLAEDTAKSVSSNLEAAANKLADVEYATACLAFRADIAAATFPKPCATSPRAASASVSAPDASLTVAAAIPKPVIDWLIDNDALFRLSTMVGAVVG